jgi:hypothetical protein
MISDPTEKAEIEQEWSTVRTLTNWSRTYPVPGLGGNINETLPDSFYNLPLVLAYSVLDHVLTQFIIEGVFRCVNRKGTPCFNLGDKMKAAKRAPTVPWVNFSRVEKGREARNGIAHQAKLLSKNDCLLYIRAIEAELRNWAIIK